MIYVFLILTLAAFTWHAVRDLKRAAQEGRAEIDRRLERLQVDAMALRRRLDALESAPAGEARPEAQPEPSEPEAAEPVAEALPPSEAPPPPEPAVPPPLPLRRPSEPVDSVPAGEAGPPPPADPSVPAAEPPPAAAPPRPPRGIDWEQWVGVRGAAVLGGVVLAIAGFFFLRYSIEAGWLQPAVRVALGLLAGTVALSGGELLRRRAYEATANGLAGAGIVLLYASTWAARALYELIGFGVAFVFMSLVTVACGFLSSRYRSLVVALLGLLGGFATPLLLSSGRDNPIGLFGYVLLLNVGLAILARKRDWPLLGYLSLGATLFYQAIWIFARMDAHEVVLGLGVLALFALFFVATGAPRRQPVAAGSGNAAAPPWLQLAGLATPVLFAVYFAANAELGEALYPLAAFLLLLGAGAAWLARVHRLPLLEQGMAAGVLVVVAVWWMRVEMTAALSWQGALAALALALPAHLALELDRRRTQADAQPVSPRASLVAAFGFLAWLVVAALFVGGEAFWAMLVGWLGLAGLLLRQAAVAGRPRRHQLAAGALGFGFCGLFLADGFGSLPLRGGPGSVGLLGLGVAVAIGFQLHAVIRRQEPRPAEISALLFPLLALFGMLAFHDLAPLLFYLPCLALALLAVLAATRRPAPLGYAVTVALLVLVHLAWSASVPGSEEALYGLVLQAATVGALTFWPFVVGRRLHHRLALYAAAAAAPAWFLSLGRLWEKVFGDDFIGALPVLLGGLSLGAAYQSRRLAGAAGPIRIGSLVWFAAAALGFLSIAIPLQLEKEWITLGWALEGLAVTALWKRIDHPGLKYFGLALLAAVSVRLIANPALLDYHPKAVWPILNWLTYTYLIPAAALLGTAYLLRPLEVERRRTWESWLYERRWPVASQACGLAAITVVFAWINLTIVDAFSAGPALDLGWERLPARDLTLSLAWAVYALLLLGLGVVRESVGLRWISLAVLVITIGKVFLYDLGELQDLYRVASLVGLAVCLILVSLLYQRFVFRRPVREEA